MAAAAPVVHLDIVLFHKPGCRRFLLPVSATRSTTLLSLFDVCADVRMRQACFFCFFLPIHRWRRDSGDSVVHLDAVLLTSFAGAEFWLTIRRRDLVSFELNAKPVASQEWDSTNDPTDCTAKLAQIYNLVLLFL